MVAGGRTHEFAGFVRKQLGDGALHETLADLDGRRARGEIPPFERVIIETSGAADPAPLLNVLLGHPLVTGAYAFEATVCAIDAQHFLASRTEYPELDKAITEQTRIIGAARRGGEPAVKMVEEMFQ